MEVNKQFNQCPNCSSERRFLESLAKELKDKGYAKKDWRFGFDFRQGVVVDKTREMAIPIGTEVPSYQILTDICLDCGTVYAVDIKSGTVTKSLAPPKIFRPGQEPPMTGQGPPMGNDPRFS